MSCDDQPNTRKQKLVWWGEQKYLHKILFNCLFLKVPEYWNYRHFKLYSQVKNPAFSASVSTLCPLF